VINAREKGDKMDDIKELIEDLVFAVELHAVKSLLPEESILIVTYIEALMCCGNCDVRLKGLREKRFPRCYKCKDFSNWEPPKTSD
jgi:hypothetical protein